MSEAIARLRAALAAVTVNGKLMVVTEHIPAPEAVIVDFVSIHDDKVVAKTNGELLAAFIVTAHNDLGELLAECARYKAALATLRFDIDVARKDAGWISSYTVSKLMEAIDAALKDEA